MHTSFAPISTIPLFSGSGPAQEAEIAKRRVLPEDVVQEAIQLVRFATNSFAVRWTYTDAGAKRMLDFWDHHLGQRAHTRIGTFETPLTLRAPHDPAWTAAWIQSRTDKLFGVSESEAKLIIIGLKAK